MIFDQKNIFIYICSVSEIETEKKCEKNAIITDDTENKKFQSEEWERDRKMEKKTKQKKFLSVFTIMTFFHSQTYRKK
jgi:hypothetical protein